ncbi:MAG TPA: TetR/AcrR family transcriptional regulator, partial [Umezawaea sp.]|nr:TetR/AcrR family transcriptional regulator [Umezawaea sp.]
MSSTPLRRQLAGGAPRPTALDALAEATRVFQAGQRVDMRGLAAALEVDRATLYRWVGSREHLLAEVLWSMIDKTVRRLRASGGTAAVVVTGAAEASMTNAGMRAFLER